MTLSLNPSDWTGWVKPLGMIGNRTPIVSQEFRGGPRNDPHSHLGVDIMYPWLPGDPKTYPDTAMSGPNKGFTIPPGTPVYASGPGQIWDAGVTSLGHHIQIDHGIVGKAGGVNTFYQHLASFAHPWQKGDKIEAGTFLGIVGGNPGEPPHLKHLHFEIWFPVAGVSPDKWARNPEPYLGIWSYPDTKIHQV